MREEFRTRFNRNCGISIIDEFRDLLESVEQNQASRSVLIEELLKSEGFLNLRDAVDFYRLIQQLNFPEQQVALKAKIAQLGFCELFNRFLRRSNGFGGRENLIRLIDAEILERFKTIRAVHQFYKKYTDKFIVFYILDLLHKNQVDGSSDCKIDNFLFYLSLYEKKSAQHQAIFAELMDKKVLLTNLDEEKFKQLLLYVDDDQREILADAFFEINLTSPVNLKKALALYPHAKLGSDSKTARLIDEELIRQITIPEHLVALTHRLNDEERKRILLYVFKLFEANSIDIVARCTANDFIYFFHSLRDQPRWLSCFIMGFIKRKDLIESLNLNDAGLIINNFNEHEKKILFESLSLEKRKEFFCLFRFTFDTQLEFLLQNKELLIEIIKGLQDVESALRVFKIVEHYLFLLPLAVSLQLLRHINPLELLRFQTSEYNLNFEERPELVSVAEHEINYFRWMYNTSKKFTDPRLEFDGTIFQQYYQVLKYAFAADKNSTLNKMIEKMTTRSRGIFDRTKPGILEKPKTANDVLSASYNNL